MSCATNLTANRNADYQYTHSFPDGTNLGGYTFRLQVRASEGASGSALIDVQVTANANGSLFTVVGNKVFLLIKKADLAALPLGIPVSDPWVGAYDVVMTDGLGVETWLFGGAFTVLEGVTR